MLSKGKKQCRKHGQNFIYARKSNMPFTALNLMKPPTAFHETHNGTMAIHEHILQQISPKCRKYM